MGRGWMMLISRVVVGRPVKASAPLVLTLKSGE
jgi:hypothetical protein